MRSAMRGSFLAILCFALSVGAASSAYAGQATGPRWKTAYLASTPMSAFYDAAAVSARDIWAVGDVNLSNGGSGTGPFVRRWNGRRWTIVHLPAAYGDGFVDAVAASSATNVWLFGEYDDNKYVFALRWNGSWKQMGRWPNVTGGADSALVLGRSDVWLFGEVGTLHYNGHSWHSYKVSVPLYEASAISASDIWAVGYPLDTYAPVVAHWHSGRWTIRLLPPASSRFPTTTPAAVLAFSDQNVWVAGAAQTAGGNVRALLLHWSGRKWHSYLGPGRENAFRGPSARRRRWLLAVLQRSIPCACGGEIQSRSLAYFRLAAPARKGDRSQCARPGSALARCVRVRRGQLGPCEQHSRPDPQVRLAITTGICAAAHWRHDHGRLASVQWIVFVFRMVSVLCHGKGSVTR